MRPALVSSALLLVLTGCAAAPAPAQVPPPARALTISGAGAGHTITYTCGPDAGTTCTDTISATGIATFTRQVQLPIGATARVTVDGIGPKSCRITDATDGIYYAKHVPELSLDDAVCQYRVE